MDALGTNGLKSQLAKRTAINLVASTWCQQIKRQSFRHSYVIKKSLYDFYSMKATFEKLQPRVVSYKDWKYFENDRFRADVLSELRTTNTEKNEEGLSDFLNTCKRILDLNASRKQKYVRGNNMLFNNKALSKEIVIRTTL